MNPPVTDGFSSQRVSEAKSIHYCEVIMDAVASQITSLTIIYSTVYSDSDQRKHQSSASLAFVRGIHRWPVNSKHKGPVTRKMFPFDDVIMFPRHSFSMSHGEINKTRNVCMTPTEFSFSISCRSSTTIKTMLGMYSTFGQGQRLKWLSRRLCRSKNYGVNKNFAYLSLVPSKCMFSPWFTYSYILRNKQVWPKCSLPSWNKLNPHSADFSRIHKCTFKCYVISQSSKLILPY